MGHLKGVKMHFAMLANSRKKCEVKDFVQMTARIVEMSAINNPIHLGFTTPVLTLFGIDEL